MPLYLTEEPAGNWRKKGFLTYYLPMDGYGRALSERERGGQYTSEISFVGSLYKEPFGNLFHYMERLEPYDKGYIDALAAVQKSIYAYNFLEEIAFRSACILRENRDAGSEKL